MAAAVLHRADSADRIEMFTHLSDGTLVACFVFPVLSLLIHMIWATFCRPPPALSKEEQRVRDIEEEAAIKGLAGNGASS